MSERVTDEWIDSVISKYGGHFTVHDSETVTALRELKERRAAEKPSLCLVKHQEWYSCDLAAGHEGPHGAERGPGRRVSWSHMGPFRCNDNYPSLPGFECEEVRGHEGLHQCGNSVWGRSGAKPTQKGEDSW